MSTDLDELLDNLTPESYRKGPKCTVQNLLDSLPPTTAEKLLAKIDDEAISAASIGKTLVTAGYRINPDLLRRHRRRKSGNGCSCA